MPLDLPNDPIWQMKTLPRATVMIDGDYVVCRVMPGTYNDGLKWIFMLGSEQSGTALENFRKTVKRMEAETPPNPWGIQINIRSIYFLVPEDSLDYGN